MAGAIVLAGFAVALSILLVRQPTAPEPPAPVTTESTPAETTSPSAEETASTAEGTVAAPAPEETDPAAPAPAETEPEPAVEPSTPIEEPGDQPLGFERVITVEDLPAEAAGYTVSDMGGIPVYSKGQEQVMLLNFGLSMPIEEWAMGEAVTTVADNAGCYLVEGTQMCVVASEDFGDVQLSSSGPDITPLVQALAAHLG